MIRNIARDHPRAIACDILFQSSGPMPDDVAVHDAMKGAPVFLPEVLEAPGKGHAGYLTKPTPGIASAAVGLGRSSAVTDVDGIVRRTYLYITYQGQRLPELMAAVVGMAPGKIRPATAHSGGAAVAKALPRGDEFLIPFAGPPGHYRQVSATDVVDGTVPAGAFKDKYVLVGATAQGLLDNYPTPVSGADGMPNIEVEANILDSLLHHRLIRELPPTETLALSIAAVWLLFFGMVRSGPGQMVTHGPLASLLILAGSLVGMVLFGVWVPPTSALITGTLAQIVWSSRRLQAASDYLARELTQLQSRAGGALIPIAPVERLPIGDSVARQMALIEETRRRMRDLRRLVADIMANFPDPVLIVSPGGRILALNAAATDLGRRLGRPMAVGDQIQPVLNDLEAAAGGHARLWPPMVTTGRSGPRGVGPGGRILEARYTATGDESGRARGWTLHLLDVTNLVSAMRQREEALRLFSHDVRSPQSAILAALEHEDFRNVSPMVRDGIGRNALRTIGLADGFMRLAQAESADYVFEPIDIFHILSDAVDALWTTAQAASVTIEIEYPDREYVVNADRAQLTRAVISLLENAVRFSPAGRSVHCALSPAGLQGRAAVACTITDETSNSEQEQLLSLFNRFARASPTGEGDEARPVRSNSIGLGLAVAHTVVTRHEGVLDCQGQVGGAVLTLTLPLYEEGRTPEACPAV